MNSISDRQRLVVVGASVRSAAQRANLLGIDVVAIDQFGDRDLKAIAQVHSLQSLFDRGDLSWCKGDGCQTALLLCGGMENRSETIQRLIGHGLVCGLTPETLSELRAPEFWARWANDSGVFWPETSCNAPNGPQISNDGDHQRRDAWLVKSRTSAGGLGVRVWKGEACESFEYLQRSVAGDVLGVTFVNLGEKSHLVGCMRSWTNGEYWGPSPFIYRGNVGPVRLEIDEQIRLTEFANRVREASGLRGVWQADFVRNQAGWWLLEINPRWSSSMELLEVIYDISLVALHMTAVLGITESKISPIDWNEHSARCARQTSPVIGKVVRYASYDLCPDQSMLDRWWDARWDGTVSSLLEKNRLADIPGDASMILKGYPICTEFAIGNSVAEITERLQQSVIDQDLRF